MVGAEARLLRVWERCTLEDKLAGKRWWDEAFADAQGIALATGRRVEPVVRAIAALSPRQAWERNLILTEAMARRRVYRNPGTFTHCARAAWDALAGKRRVYGPKVTAFGDAILGDENAPVIDVWMMRAMGLWNGHGPRDYNAVAAVLTNAARRVRLPVRDFQATVWLAVRNPQREFDLW